MKNKNIIVMFFTLIALVACSSSEDRGGQNVVPQIKLSDIQSNGCINLQKLAESVNGRFSFPFRNTTTQFTSSHNSRSVEIRNFGVQEGLMTDFPHLRQPVQSDCESVLLTSHFGQPVKYDVVNYTDNSIRISLSESQDNELDGVRREAFVESLNIHELEYTFIDDQSVLINISGNLNIVGCGIKTKYQKTTMYRWGRNLSALPQAEVLDANYRLKYADLLGPAVNEQANQKDQISNIKTAQHTLYKDLENDPCI